MSGVPAGFSVFTFLHLIVRGNPAATAANILGAEGPFRLAIVAEIAGILFFVSSMLFFYELLKPVSRRLALLLVFFSLIGSVIQALDSLADIAALILLKGGDTLSAFPTEQAQQLAFVFLRLHMLVYDLALVFFGVACILIGTLVFRSMFLPRILGVFMAIDGLGYLTISFATFLAPVFAAHLQPILPFGTALLGEGSLMLWLVVRGVNAGRWEAQAAAHAT